MLISGCHHVVWPGLPKQFHLKQILMLHELNVLIITVSWALTHGRRVGTFPSFWVLFSDLSRCFGLWLFGVMRWNLYRGFRRDHPVYGDVRSLIGRSGWNNKTRTEKLWSQESLSCSRYLSLGPAHPVAHHVNMLINFSWGEKNVFVSLIWFICFR